MIKGRNWLVQHLPARAEIVLLKLGETASKQGKKQATVHFLHQDQNLSILSRDFDQDTSLDGSRSLVWLAGKGLARHEL